MGLRRVRGLMPTRCLLAGAAAVLAVALVPPTALAALPANDTPFAPGVFTPYLTANGTPREREAVAELVESRPDRAVPRCFGRSSFARTVWYRVP